MAIEQEDSLTDDQLDAFFQAGRAGGEALPEPLFARIMAGARGEAGLPGATVLAAAAPPAEPGPGRGPLAAVLAAIGGWPAMAGMLSATLAGLWLGFASPDTLGGVIGFGADYTVGDFMPALSLDGDG